MEVSIIPRGGLSIRGVVITLLIRFLGGRGLDYEGRKACYVIEG